MMRVLFVWIAGLVFIVVACPARAAESDLKDVLNRLKSATQTERRAAAKDLAELGIEAKAAVPELTKALEDTDAEVRYYAVAALGQIGPDAKSAAKTLAEKFDDPVFEVRTLTIEAFPRLGREVLPALIDAMKSKSFRVRINATMSARGFEKDLEPALDTLIECLNDDYWMVRQNSAGALAYLGLKAQRAIPELLRLARTDDNEKVRHNAIDSLFELKAEPDDLLPLALAALKDPQAYPKTRFVATAKLINFREKARPAVPILIELLKTDKEPAIRTQAAQNLPWIGGEADEILGPLTAALKDPDPDVQSGAAYGLRILGPKAAAAVPAIRALLAAIGNGQRPARVYAGFDCRVNLIEALGAIGNASIPAIPDIIPALENSQAEIRDTAAKVLATFGKDAVAAIPALQKLSQDSDPKVRETAAAALKRIKSADRPASQPQPGDFEARFTKTSFVEVEKSAGELNLNDDFTIELWARWSESDRHEVIAGDEAWPSMSAEVKVSENRGWTLRKARAAGHDTIEFNVGIDQGPDGWFSLKAQLPERSQDWTHIAVCRRSDSLLMFADAKRLVMASVAGKTLMKSPSPLYIGVRRHAFHNRNFYGYIRGFRVSTLARYTQNFPPLKSFKFDNDDATMVLFNFDKTSETHVFDTSGHDRHGLLDGVDLVPLKE
jgi:HEAT repeat protein